MTGEESRPMGQASSCAVSYNGPITGRFLIFHDARAISHLHRDNPTETHAGQGSTLSSGGGGEVLIWRQRRRMVINCLDRLFRKRSKPPKNP